MVTKTHTVISRMLEILTKKQKGLAILVIAVSLLSAVFEMLGVSVIIPLVNAILNPGELWEYQYINVVAGYINVETDIQLARVILLFTILVYIIKNLFFILASWIKNKYSFKVQRETSVSMMTSYMNRGYDYFLNHNFNEMRQGVEADIQALYYVLTNLIQIFAQGVTIVLISVFLLVSDWQLFIGVAISTIVCVIFMVCIFRKNMLRAGRKVRKYSIKSSQTLLEAFHGIKEVFVMHKQKHFIKKYNAEVTKKNNASIVQTFGSEIPAYIIEMICITGILIILTCRLGNIDNPQSFVATLASFAVGAFRMLPALGKISSSVNAINASLPGFESVYENIIEARDSNLLYFDVAAEDDNRYKNIQFEQCVSIENISFKYDDNARYVLNGLSLDIGKGTSVAFVGESGAGKSTLADIVLGLLKPQSGTVKIDGIDINFIPNRWSKLIGFVPQSIFLSDSTICENVAFGISEDEIDYDRVKEALKKADLLDFVESLPMKDRTEVGDRGVRLSGGQRQRIGIARALYHQPEILVLDEATSALDNDTEKSVMESIDSLHGQMTLIVIAHRLTTVRNCDVIYEIANGKAKKVTYDQIVGN